MDGQSILLEGFEEQTEGVSGAGIGHIVDMVERGMSQTIVCLSAGGNDIRRVGSVDIFIRFRETLGKVRNKGGIPVVCGILPRCGKGDEWLSRAISVNNRLAAHCDTNGWLFIDTWNLFFGKEELYAKDGVHLSFKEVEVLSNALDRALSFLRDFFLFSLGEGRRDTEGGHEPQNISGQ